MDIKIFSAHSQRPRFEAMHDLFIPIWAGGEPSTDGKWLENNKIPRIANSVYNDMSHQFFVYKHCLHGLKYVGFEQYRRLFPFPAFVDRDTPLLKMSLDRHYQSPDWHLSVGDEIFAELLSRRRVASASDLQKFRLYINDVDILLTRACAMGSLREQWLSICLDAKFYDILLECVRCSAFYLESPFDLDEEVAEGYFCNMYVMKVDIFRGYMVHWQEIMLSLSFYMQGQIERMPAFLSERLFSIYIRELLRRQSLVVKNLPFVWCPDV